MPPDLYPTVSGQALTYCPPVPTYAQTFVGVSVRCFWKILVFDAGDSELLDSERRFGWTQPFNLQLKIWM